MNRLATIKAVALLSLMTLLLTSEAQNSELTEKSQAPIKGAFGLILGDVYVPKGDEKGIDAAHGTATFKPDKPFRSYELYSVSLTPIDARIHTILALKSFPSIEAANEELEVVKAALEAKYGGQMVQETTSLGKAYSLRRGENAIMIAVKLGYPRYGVAIIFSNPDLMSQAKKDRAKIEASKTDTSGI